MKSSDKVDKYMTLYFAVPFWLLLVGAGSTQAAHQPQSSPPPPIDLSALQAALSQREAALDHLTTTWQSTYHQHDIPMSPQQIQQGVQQMRQQGPDQLRKQGITDPVVIKVMMNGFIRNYQQSWQGADYHGSTPLSITREGARTLVQGTYQQINDKPGATQDVNEGCRLFYDGSDGLCLNDSAQYGQQQQQPSFSLAWQSPGESVRYDASVPVTLYVSATELAMLGGFNPLALYGGAAWRIAKVTPSLVQVQAHLADVRGFPVDLKIDLSRAHDFAPARLEVDNIGAYSIHPIVYTTEGYQRWGKTWLCSTIEETDDTPKVTDFRYDYSLTYVAKVVPITVTSGSLVHDYRLFGPQEYIDTQMTPSQTQNIVIYPWSGHFLSLDDLKQIQAARHPDQDTPAPDN